MALHVPKAPGMAQMLKDGARYFSGLEEAVYRNITACKEFAQTVRTAYGPNGMNKMVINHLEKLFVTSDAATIIRELDVEHPAAKLLVLASEMQESEVGDGTNFVIIFAGALLEHAEELLRLGITTTEIVEGYELALEKALELLPKLVIREVKDWQDISQIEDVMKTSIMSKQYGKEDLIANLVCKACSSILPADAIKKNVTFNVDNVRVCKILGSGLHSSQVIQGMVFKRQVEGDITKVEKAKVAVYTCPVDIMQTETKGTVLIKSANELLNFSRGEESLLESQIKAIADSGATVIVSGGKFGDMALYYVNKYNLMAVRLPSKFDLRRLCRAVKAVALTKLNPPTKEELGYADSVHVDELGDTSIVVFQNQDQESRISTIVVRGSTDNYMDDIERAIDDGVNTFKAITKNGNIVPGGGATEIELASKIASYGDTIPGLEQYAVRKFAVALEVFPKTLSDNSGTHSSGIISKLYAAHKEGKINHGFNIDGTGEESVIDVEKAGILDLYLTKYWALKYATNAACTILKIDQIIMAKRAGGPKPKQNSHSDDES
ncbi:T-complex protein 1 subunit theta [Copidosoma floridanum]|uniref:T-complex protein 1 subunit theta n=1 Tax=Copidosoma floridanum TaxID=29053 RepID=UPI0006C98CB5|nr:T-complex protein 1 subunit theta [Copidosoma floridanum]XP_014217308.1 T-complex protein 1 subunit theta [Copidosoma floridanum]